MRQTEERLVFRKLRTGFFGDGREAADQIEQRNHGIGVSFTHAIRYTIFEILFSDFEWEKTRYPEVIYFAGLIDIFRTVLKRSQRQVC